MAPVTPWALEVRGVSRLFRDVAVLRDVSLAVAPGEIHALLGPNGAGKTTLLRILAGLVDPSSGDVVTAGRILRAGARERRQLVGLVPSGGRSFYLRLSGFENLLFFARLHGLDRKLAAERAATALSRVGLADAADRRVGLYSNGMVKRLATARALLVDPPVLLVDEATHDLDPEGASRIRGIVRLLADEGTAVVWATQRIEEIRGFAQRVTLIAQGKVAFAGSVSELTARASARTYLVRVRDGDSPADVVAERLNEALTGLGCVESAHRGDAEHFLLSLEATTVLGDAISAMSGARVALLDCREARPELEEAFLRVTAEAGTEQ